MKKSLKAASRTPGRPEWLIDEAWPFSVDRLDDHGLDVAYTDIGTGPTLVFVNVGMWSILWRDIIGCLQDRYRCITLDAPGCGLSGPARTKVDLVAAADAIDGLVRTLDLVDIALVVHDL